MMIIDQLIRKYSGRDKIEALMKKTNDSLLTLVRGVICGSIIFGTANGASCYASGYHERAIEIAIERPRDALPHFRNIENLVNVEHTADNALTLYGLLALENERPKKVVTAAPREITQPTGHTLRFAREPSQTYTSVQKLPSDLRQVNSSVLFSAATSSLYGINRRNFRIEPFIDSDVDAAWNDGPKHYVIIGGVLHDLEAMTLRPVSEAHDVIHVEGTRSALSRRHPKTFAHYGTTPADQRLQRIIESTDFLERDISKIKTITQAAYTRNAVVLVMGDVISVFNERTSYTRSGQGAELYPYVTAEGEIDELIMRYATDNESVRYCAITPRMQTIAFTCLEESSSQGQQRVDAALRQHLDPAWVDLNQTIRLLGRRN